VADLNLPGPHAEQLILPVERRIWRPQFETEVELKTQSAMFSDRLLSATQFLRIQSRRAPRSGA
jgi:hypothetical protein